MNIPIHPLRAAAFWLGALLVSQALVHAAITTYTFTPNADTWVANGTASQGSLPTLSIGGSGAVKEIYLRFRIFATVGTGTPLNGKLRLHQSAGFGGSTPIRVYAANNRAANASADWLESIVWGDQPKYIATPELASALPRASGGYLEFDVADYISGPGDYSFCVRTSSTTRIDFHSREGANDPQLTVDKDDTLDGDYYRRLPSELNDRGALYRARYAASSVNAVSDISYLGYFDVTKQPYGAKNDGLTDATFAIQRAVNEARDARVALYFPPGDYKVSNTLQLVQGWNDHETIDSNVGDNLGAIRWNVRDFPCVLLGHRSTTDRSRIVLAIAGTDATFNDAANPKPVLRFWSRHNSPNPEVNTANSQYYQTLDNIDVNIAAGANNGAVGIDMDAAQGTNLTNTTITATGAYAGIIGGTGPGGYTYGVLVDGGQYGGYFEAAHCPLIINSKFKNQDKHSLYHAGRGPLTLVGVQIESTSAMPEARVKLNATNDNPWMAALNVVDSSIQGTGLLIDTNRSVSLTNTYLKNGSTAISAIKQTDPVGALIDNFQLETTAWRLVSEYARGVNIAQQKYPAPPPNSASRVGYWLNGALNTTANAHYIDGGPATTVPTWLTFGNANHRHALSASPQFSPTDINPTGVINAVTTTLGSGPISEGGTTNAARLNAIIAVAGDRPIFIPAGEFKLEATVNLKSNTRLFGIGPAFSILRATDDIGAAPMISTDAVAAATCVLADLKLLLPMNIANDDTSMINWRAGASSTVRNVGLDDRWAPEWASLHRTVPLAKINGATGGGKWAGVWMLEGKNAAAPSGWYLEVNGTTQPLKFYMLNLEHSAQSPQGKFINANNFDIYQMKAESQGSSVTNPENELLWFEGCQYFRAFGFGGAATPDTPNPDVGPTGHTLIRLHPFGQKNCNHYMITQLQFQQPSSGDPAPSTYWRLMEKMTTDTDYIGRVQGDRQAVLVRRGTPPNN